MHFEILVEGQTELTSLSILFPKLVGEYNEPNTWTIHKHQGIGKLPEDLSQTPNIKDRTLLHNFPSKIRAYSKSMKENEKVLLLLDLDDKNLQQFKEEISKAIELCENSLELTICFAIEELEAWFIGDIKALEASYEILNRKAIKNYVQDSICGTWEVLADIIYPGGSAGLLKYGKRSRRVLEQKRKWASKIAPNMNISSNRSPSFKYFVSVVQKDL